MSKRRIFGAFIVAGVISLTGCERAEPVVSFSVDVQPVLEQHCLECHQPGAEGYIVSGLGVENYAALMKGTKFGPMVIPGDSSSSNLIVLIQGGAHSSITMPHGRQKMSEEEVETLKVWVDQGALDN